MMANMPYLPINHDGDFTLCLTHNILWQHNSLAANVIHHLDEFDYEIIMIQIIFNKFYNTLAAMLIKHKHPRQWIPFLLVNFVIPYLFLSTIMLCTAVELDDDLCEHGTERVN